MATSFLSKTEKKEALYREKASVPQYRPVSKRTQSSRYGLRSSAKTQVEGEVNHAKRQIHPTISDNVKIRAWPREHFSRNPDRELGNQDFIVIAPPNTQCFSPLNKQSSLQRSSEPDHDLKPDSHSDFDSLTPPPSDPEALRKTWEQVRIFNTKIPKPISAMSTTLSSISVGDVLNPRGGRIRWETSAIAHDTWNGLKNTANGICERDNTIQESLQRAGIWLLPETEEERSKIKAKVEYLKKGHLRTNESRWSVGFWQEFFFPEPAPPENRQSLERFTETRQLHTLNRKTTALEMDSDCNSSSCKQETEDISPENRYPPIYQKDRSSVDHSRTPYDVDPNRLRNGLVFSDISYAVSIDDAMSEDLPLLNRLATMRLYISGEHYLEGFKIEVKPLEHNEWSGDARYRYAVRYLTLTAMTMLHEYLKLCYMSSKDEDFFPLPETLNIHLLAAVGCTARHFIHRIRREKGPLKYESYFVKEFNLEEAGARDQFRERLNSIQVLHVTVFKEAVKRAIEEVLALGQPEIDRRLQKRTHKGVGFQIDVRDEVLGIHVRHDVKNPPLVSLGPLVEEPTDNKKKICPAWTRRKRQCTNAAPKDQLLCGIHRRQASVKPQKS